MSIFSFADTSKYNISSVSANAQASSGDTCLLSLSSALFPTRTINSGRSISVIKEIQLTTFSNDSLSNIKKVQ